MALRLYGLEDRLAPQGAEALRQGLEPGELLQGEPPPEGLGLLQAAPQGLQVGKLPLGQGPFRLGHLLAEPQGLRLLLEGPEGRFPLL